MSTYDFLVASFFYPISSVGAPIACQSHSIESQFITRVAHLSPSGASVLTYLVHLLTVPPIASFFFGQPFLFLVIRDSTFDHCLSGASFSFLRPPLPNTFLFFIKHTFSSFLRHILLSVVGTFFIVSLSFPFPVLSTRRLPVDQAHRRHLVVVSAAFFLPTLRRLALFERRQASSLAFGVLLPFLFSLSRRRSCCQQLSASHTFSRAKVSLVPVRPSSSLLLVWLGLPCGLWRVFLWRLLEAFVSASASASA
ncbi:hypothetical protein C8R44DRAFT_241644, partial [Mycena epipterygia]